MLERVRTGDDPLEHFTSWNSLFQAHVSRVFEQCGREATAELFTRLHGRPPGEIGKWWHRGHEIDWIARRPGEATLFLEVKWSLVSRWEARRILNTLAELASRTGLMSRVNYMVVAAWGIRGSRGWLERVEDPPGGALVDLRRWVEELSPD